MDMSRMKRDVEFINTRIQLEDNEYLHSEKRTHSEQIDAVLHRILMTYRSSAEGQAEFMYNEQVKITQRWMEKCVGLQEQLKARNQVLDQVLEE